MSKKNLIAIVIEAFCAAAMIFLLVRNGFNWIMTIAAVLNIVAATLNTITANRKDS